MDLETDEPRTVKIEWRIENLACWDHDNIHNKRYIESPHSPTLPDFKVLYYPKSYPDETKLICSFGKLRRYEGELSFFAANESLIRTLEILPAEEGDENPVTISAPDLSEIAKEQRADHGDHIILTFQFKVEHALLCVGMLTTVEVISEMVLPFTGAKLLEDPQLAEKPKLLMAITYVRENGGEEEQLNLERVYYNSRVIDLQLTPATKWAFRDILITYNLKMYKGEPNTLTMEDDSYQIFKKADNLGMEPYTLTDSLLLKDLSAPGCRIVLHLRFISGKIKNSTYSEVFCGFYTDSCEDSSCEPSNSNPPKNASSFLKNELKCLYQNKEFTDFELHCANTTFPVHKAILSARSPFFKQLLLSKRKDEAFGSLDIKDLDSVTLDQFLDFLYSGTVDNLQEESAIKLYYAADTYQVPSLKTECVAFLSDNISVSNACNVLSLANKFQDARLTSSAQNFIINNFQEVAKSKEWHGYMITAPQLLVDTISDFAAKGFFNK